MSNTPLKPVGDGSTGDKIGDRRRPNGRFAPGNKAAKGNPHARQVQQLRAALFEAVTPDDLREVVAAMVAKAKGGDIPAAREVLERTLGKPEALDFIERLDELERQIAELQKEDRP